MGGKQKRAAKYKKWLDAQNHLAQMQKMNANRENGSSGDTDSDQSGESPQAQEGSEYKPIPYNVQIEMIKHRFRTKNVKNRSQPWILKKLRPLENLIITLPPWARTVFIGMFVGIFSFFFLRAAIQLYSPVDGNGSFRSTVYNSIRSTLPKPVLKLFRLVDYLMTSPSITFSGIYSIFMSSEELDYPTYYYHR